MLNATQTTVSKYNLKLIASSYGNASETGCRICLVQKVRLEQVQFSLSLLYYNYIVLYFMAHLEKKKEKLGL